MMSRVASNVLLSGLSCFVRSADGHILQRRSGRSKARVKYVEPKLGVKLRQVLPPAMFG